MIVPTLYKDVVALDRNQHRQLRLHQAFRDFSVTAQMNSLFVAAVEFADVAREYPIVFVRAGKHPQTGEEQVAPMAVLGLAPSENLYLLPGGGWRTPYVPALLRRYPFAMTPAPDDQLVVCVDRSFSGLSETEGEPLFDTEGQPTALLKETQGFLERFEVETQRTQVLCERLMKAGLLQEMRFDATLPDGKSFRVDGFLSIDQKRLAELPDADVLELHRNGMLALIHLQQASLGLMRRLVEWRTTAAASH